MAILKSCVDGPLDASAQLRIPLVGSIAIMCPACWRGTMAAGPDGIRDPVPNKPAASRAIDPDGISGSSVRPIVISVSTFTLRRPVLRAMPAPRHNTPRFRALSASSTVPAGGFREGFVVVAVVLAAFDEGLHLLRRDQPQPVTQRLQRAGPMEPTRARVRFRRKTGPSDSGMPCNVNTALDVSIATRLYAVMEACCIGVLTSPSLARDAVGPSTPTSPGDDGSAGASGDRDCRVAGASINNENRAFN